MKISQLPAAIRIKARENQTNCKLRSYNKSRWFSHIVWLVEYSRGGITFGMIGIVRIVLKDW
jgi:hypothetical protein